MLRAFYKHKCLCSRSSRVARAPVNSAQGLSPQAPVSPSPRTSIYSSISNGAFHRADTVVYVSRTSSTLFQRRNYTTAQEKREAVDREFERGVQIKEEVIKLCDEFQWETAAEVLRESFNARQEALFASLSGNIPPGDERRLLVLAPLVETILQLGQLYRTTGELSLSANYFRMAMKSMRMARSRIEEHGGNPDEVQAQKDNIDLLLCGILSDLGHTEELLDHNHDAQRYFEEAILIMERRGKHEHQQTAFYRGQLGMLYEKVGNYEAARPYHELTLKYFPHIELWAHPHFGTTLHPQQKMSATPWSSRDLDDPNKKPVSQYTILDEEINAYKEMEKAEKRRTTLKREKREVGKSSEGSEIRELEEERGEKRGVKVGENDVGEEAEAPARPSLTEDLSALESIIAVQIKSLGGEHVALWPLYYLQSSIFRQLKLFDEAEKVLLNLFELQKKAKGEEHAHLATTLAHMALVALSRGDPSQAREILKEVMGLRRNLFGDDHVHVALTEFDLALASWRTQALSDALFLLQEASEKLAKKVGTNHPYAEAAKKTLDDIEKELVLFEEQQREKESKPQQPSFEQ